MHAIPTLYAGTRFRSRLATWAKARTKSAIVGAYCHGLIGIHTTGWLIRKLRLGGA